MHFSVKKWQKAWLRKESAPEFDLYFSVNGFPYIFMKKTKQYAFVFMNMTLLL